MRENQWDYFCWHARHPDTPDTFQLDTPDWVISAIIGVITCITNYTIFNTNYRNSQSRVAWAVLWRIVSDRQTWPGGQYNNQITPSHLVTTDSVVVKSPSESRNDLDVDDVPALRAEMTECGRCSWSPRLWPWPPSLLSARGSSQSDIWSHNIKYPPTFTGQCWSFCQKYLVILWDLFAQFYLYSTKLSTIIKKHKQTQPLLLTYAASRPPRSWHWSWSRTRSELNDFSSAFSFSILGWTRIRERLTLTLVKGKLNVYFTWI